MNPEVMNQIAFKVIGNELCVTMADEAAQMELNATGQCNGSMTVKISL